MLMIPKAVESSRRARMAELMGFNKRAKISESETQLAFAMLLLMFTFVVLMIPPDKNKTSVTKLPAAVSILLLQFLKIGKTILKDSAKNTENTSLCSRGWSVNDL